MKLSNIFNVDTSKGGGIKLFKKIIDKYNLGNEYKDLKTNVEKCSSGGASSRIKYYHCKDSIAMAFMGDLVAAGYIPYVNAYTYDSSNNPLDTYIGTYKLLSSLGISYFAVRHIIFQPISVIINNNRLAINTLEELFLMIADASYIEHFEEITEEEFYKID